jgi:type IV pilus assembly protein PilB
MCRTRYGLGAISAKANRSGSDWCIIASMTERVRIGELLLATRLITREQLDHALELQKTDTRRLGEIIVASRFVSEAKVTQIISQQLSVPWVSLEYIDFSRQLLNLVSAEIAQKHTLVPIYVRRGKNHQETLYIAMEDPSDPVPLEEVRMYAGLSVRPMIAPPSDIRSAIRAYYLELAPDAVPASEPSIVVTTLPPEQVLDAPSSLQNPGSLAPIEQAPVSTLELLSVAPADERPVVARDSEMPEPPKKSQDLPEMITVTMLDGTQMKLPAKRKAGPSSAPGEMTARDLVEALRAQAKGTDLSQVFGEDVNWQQMFSALLSLLLKKHLIHDWEFVRELKG